MRNLVMNSYVSRAVILVLALSIATACTKESIELGSPGKTGQPARPQDDPLAGNGTMQGGGGNGLNGKPLEHYVRNIVDLPEYKQYIAPILRKMSSTQPDALVAYLDWAARHKTWYFLPVTLPALGKDQVDTFFKSDQLALHSEQRIYIEAPTYVKMTPHDRALLLMHEMVMGARLLMKKTPLEQCETLSKHTAQSLCKDPDMERMARPPKRDDDPNVMDADDHQRVRAMTAYLMKENQDLSKMKIRSVRRQLTFSVPWDETVSDLTLVQFSSALETSVKTQERFQAKKPNWSANWIGDSDTLECDLLPTFTKYESDRGSYEFLGILIRFSTRTEQLANLGGAVSGLEGMPAPVATGFVGDRAEENKHWNTVFYHGITTWSANFKPTGVLDPNDSKKFLDKVELISYSSPLNRERPNDTAMKYEFYVSREAHPRVVGIVARVVAVIDGEELPPPYSGRKKEYLPIKSIRPTICWTTPAP